jgi:tetratricopeptide (TPR) repeat protein
MNRSTWLLLVAAVALIAIGVTVFYASRPEPEWTTRSAEALEEMRQGIENGMRFYDAEARSHYDRALELDPDFTAARLRRAGSIEREGREAFAAEVEKLRAADRTRLNARETFMLDYFLARVDREHAKADKLLTSYLEVHPRDPFVLSIRCGLEFQARRLSVASDCLERLLAIDPNWAMAQNHLGYIAMAEGRFDEAEELFRTYLFIAPQQANPHDSMAELLLLRGRYDEAARELEEAVAIRPDFCAAWRRTVQLAVLRGDSDSVGAAFDRLNEQGRCRRNELEGIRCYAMTWQAILAGDLETGWNEQRSADCGKGGSDYLVAVRAGFVLGHRDEALAMLDKLREQDRLYGDREPILKGVVLHLSGIEAAADGRFPVPGPNQPGRQPWERAESSFRAADQALSYQGSDEGTFKLFNRLDWAHVLGDLGRTEEAGRLRAEVAAVNPEIGAAFHGFPRSAEEWRRGGWRRPPAREARNP